MQLSGGGAGAGTHLTRLVIGPCVRSGGNEQPMAREATISSPLFLSFFVELPFVNVKCNYTGIRQHKNSPKPFLQFQIIDFFFHFFPFHA